MKLLATDLDGTLVFKDKNYQPYVKEADLKAIQSFRSQGNVIGVCTGRSPAGTKNGIEDIEFDFYITCSGAAIYDKDDNLIYESYMSKDIIYRMYEMTKDQLLYFVGEDGKYYVLNSPYEQNHHDTINSFEEMPFEKYYGLSIVTPNDVNKATELKLQLEAVFKDEISVNQNEDSLDIVASGITKGTGLAFMKDYYHLSDDDICAIGDSFNDLPMLHAAYHSFTFTYANKLVQKETKYVVESLAQAIDLLTKQL